MPDHPSGTVTFLFSDIEGSTRLWERDPAVMGRALRRHNDILEAEIAGHGGVHFKTIGDAFQAAFPDPRSGVAAAVAAQTALAAEVWPETGPLRVRMALHLGEAHPDAKGDYLAPCLNRLSRLLSTGAGGQVLVTEALARQVEDALPDGVTLRALGRHRLRDLLEPEQVTQVVIAGLPDTFPPLKSLEGFATNLPVLATALLGRKRELETLAELIDGGTRLITVVGTGGVGKTHLALQAAADLLDRFPDGAWLVRLGEIADADLLLSRIAETLGIREGEGLDLREVVFAYLAPRQIMIVLDNFEQLLAASPVVVELLAHCPGLRLLVTSRQRLDIAGERLLPVEPLPLPQWRTSLETMQRSPAVQLFVERARVHDPRFDLDDHVAEIVASICVRLDGLPLGIELAAAQLAHHTPAELLQALDDRFRLLRGGRRDTLSHQQTLEAAIAWSYDRLPPPAQATFRALSAFAGGWSRDAAAAVAGALDDSTADEPPVAALVEASLVRRLAVEGEVSRWSMLQSIRDFADQRLEAAGEAAAVRERHARWCLGFAQIAGAALDGAQQAGWLDQLEREHDNARAALLWSGESGRVDLQLALTTALANFWQMRGYLSEGRRWLEAALAHAAADDEHRLQAMVEAGILAQVQGDNDAAAGWFERALERARSLGDRGREAALLNNLGAVALWRGESEAAERLFQEALTTAETAGDRRRRADALANLGAIAHYQGDVSTALTHYLEGVAVWRELQDAYGIADMLLNIVQLLAPVSEHRDRARSAGEEALSRYRALRDPQGEALALSSLGLLALAEGQFEQAAQRFDASLTLFRQIEDVAGEARALGNLGLVTLDRGDVTNAAERLAAALRLATEVDDLDAIAYWLEAMAAVRVAQQDELRAARLYGAVAALRDRIAIPRAAELAPRFETNEAILRERMGSEYEAASAAGRALSLEEARREALAEGSPVSATSPDAALHLLDNLLGLTRNG